MQRFVQRYGMRLGAARFVAGETLDAAVPVLRRLNEQGLLTNTTLLGEGVRDEAETRAVVAAYREVLDRIARRGAADERRAQADAPRPRDRRGARVRATSPSSSSTRRGSATSSASTWRSRRHVDATLRIYRRLREAGHENVGTVLQSYLYRSEDDLESLLAARAEPAPRQGRVPRAAGRRLPATRRDVDAAYVRLLETSLARRRLHRDRDARRDADRARDRVRERARHPDASASSSRCCTASRPQLQLDLVAARLRRPRRDAVRARLVPLPHAPACRAAGERSVSASESRPRLSSTSSTAAIRTRIEVAREQVPGVRRRMVERERPVVIGDLPRLRQAEREEEKAADHEPALAAARAGRTE